MTEKIALITGASSGFGEAIARRFSALGYRLVLAARRYERLQQLQAELATPCHLLELDVRHSDAIQTAVEQLPADYSEIDLLVNNAGLASGLEPAQQAVLENWDAMVDTNIKGLLYMTRALLPGMVQRNRGHIINIGSVAGSWPYAGGNAYGATKAFVKQFSLNLRADLAGTRVRVTNIEPGLAETEFSLVRLKGDQAAADRVYAGTEPLVADDIAESVVWASQLPEHVNINRIEIMPTCQSFAGFSVSREP